MKSMRAYGHDKAWYIFVFIPSQACQSPAFWCCASEWRPPPCARLSWKAAASSCTALALLRSVSALSSPISQKPQPVEKEFRLCSYSCHRESTADVGHRSSFFCSSWPGWSPLARESFSSCYPGLCQPLDKVMHLQADLAPCPKAPTFNLPKLKEPLAAAGHQVDEVVGTEMTKHDNYI